MKKLIIINREQFGYHIDNYYYCYYLRGIYEINYICFDYGKRKIKLNCVDIFYVSNNNSKIRRYLRFMRSCFHSLIGCNSIVFVKYFQGASILKFLFPNHVFVLDIRSASVNPSIIKRYLYDSILKIEAMTFENITVISEGLRKKLALNHAKTKILPLGAIEISGKAKKNDYIKLLYVGTLFNRNIEETIYGLNSFISKTNVKIEYTIIGEGINNELEELKSLVNKLGLTQQVKFTGYVPQYKLSDYFDTCNVGVSFIPITDYYNFQPPTKTFEYLMSGLPTIATRTTENMQIITEQNGILINDNRNSFEEGLLRFLGNIGRFDDAKIRKSVKKYKWENIVKDNLTPYLNQLYRKL